MQPLLLIQLNGTGVCYGQAHVLLPLADAVAVTFSFSLRTFFLSIFALFIWFLAWFYPWPV
jgi:hypothetical protein